MQQQQFDHGQVATGTSQRQRRMVVVSGLPVSK